MDLNIDIVCDFDGTLIDTEEALHLAYAEAFSTVGKTISSGIFHGLPWQEWCPKNIKDIKDHLYPEYAKKYVRLTQFGKLIDFSQISILTAASEKGVDAAIKGYFRSDNLKLNSLGYSCSSKIKNEILKLRCQGLSKDTIKLYFDDLDKLQVVKETDYNLCLVDGDRVLLRNNGEEKWIQLSSQQELMKDLKELYLPTINHS
jgi:hypothetical protein